MYKRVLLHPGDLHNLGDLALLFQCVDGLRSVPEIQGATYMAGTWGTVDAELKEQLNSHSIEMYSQKDLFRLLGYLPNSLHVWSGGQLVRDNSSIASLVLEIFSVRIGSFLGTRSVVVGCGISDLGQLRLKLYRALFKQTSLFAVRDDLSFERAPKILGPATKLVCTEDLIHYPGSTNQSLQGNEIKSDLIIAPCADPSEGRFVDAELLCEWTSYARTALGIKTVKLVGHDNRPNMDVAAISHVAAAFDKRSLPYEVITGSNLTELIGHYSAAALVLTNRLHAAMFGLLSGASVFVLDDGNSKLAQASKNYRLPMIPKDTLAPDDIAKVIAQHANLKSSEISAVVAGAERNASRNFELVKMSI